MMKIPETRLIVFAALAAGAIPQWAASPPDKPRGPIDPKILPRVGTIDERFQSYNIEMVEVTGGRFWKPYDSIAKTEPSSATQPAGMSASLYEFRAPIDLSNH